jgi:hypothetical protein
LDKKLTNYPNKKITIRIINITITQILKFLRNCFSWEFDCKNPGRTKSKTPTINMTESNLSIKKLL